MNLEQKNYEEKSNEALLVFGVLILALNLTLAFVALAIYYR